MPIRQKLIVSLGVAIALAATPPVPAAEECAITITAPEEGDRVGGQVLVKGSAEIPPESHLWVLVGIEGLSGWWPQGNGEARLQDGEWKVLSNIGQPPDVGLKFEIAAIAVTDETSRSLVKWFKDANEREQYDSIDFPSPFPGCVPETITVEKTSH